MTQKGPFSYLESPDIRKPHFQEKKLSVGN